jgi:hypothetical protein
MVTNVMETNDRRDTHGGVPPDEDAGTFDRSFKYAIIVYAVAEFFAIALLLWYKCAR